MGHSRYWENCIQEIGAVAEKPHNTVVKFDTYQNLQQHRVILPLKYTKYMKNVFQLQNTNYLCLVNKIQNKLKVF